MRRSIHLAILTLTTTSIGIPVAGQDQTRTSAAQLTEKAIYAEDTVGDLADAAKLYRRIIADHPENTKAVHHAKARLSLIQIVSGKTKAGVSTLQSLSERLSPTTANVSAVPSSAEDVLASVDLIRANYIDELKMNSRQSKAAFASVISELDSYSSYVNKEQLEQLYINIDAKTVGIGVEIGFKCQGERIAVRRIQIS